jgi:hypothetical protein
MEKIIWTCLRRLKIHYVETRNREISYIGRMSGLDILHRNCLLNHITDGDRTVKRGSRSKHIMGELTL